LKLPRFIVAAGAIALGLAISAPLGADESAKLNVNVTCRCTDAVGQNFCDLFKQKIDKSAGYQLADDTSGYGMALHFSCVDLWKGIDDKLIGRMSAISVAFTIYSDKLPGEVFEDSSVFRVGKDKVPEMSDQVVLALGQLVSANSKVFETMRENAAGGSPAASASPAGSPAAESSPLAPEATPAP
jgi:hypothetical protein